MSKICPQCQAVLSDDARFCHVCGYKIPEQTETEQKSDASNLTAADDLNLKSFTDIKSEEVIKEVKSGNIFKRAISIMIKPKSEWELVANEKPRIPLLIFGYSLIFSIIPVVSLIIGQGLVGRRVGFFMGYVWHRSFTAGILDSIAFLIAAFTAIIVGAVIINILAPAFKSEKNFGRAMQLTTYSFTPVFFGGAFYIIPFLSFLAYLVGLYGIFVLLMGIQKIMKTPNNTYIGYFFASIGIMYGIYFITKWIFHAIFWAIYKTAFYSTIHFNI